MRQRHTRTNRLSLLRGYVGRVRSGTPYREDVDVHSYLNNRRRSGARGLTAVVDDAAVSHSHEALGGVGNRLVVSDQQDRLAAGVQTGEQLEHFLATLRVERAGRLIGQQQRWFVGKCSGDRQALPLTARQRRGRLLGLVADAEQIEQVSAPGFGRPCACVRR